MNISRVLFFFMCLNSSVAFSQSIIVEVQSGLGSFKMNDLKEFNDDLLSSLSIEPALIDNFPSYFYYQPSVSFRKNNNSIGLIYSFQSTGSRYSIEDFSGEVLYDATISSGMYGLKFEHYFMNKNWFDVAFDLELGICKSNLEYYYYTSVYDHILENSREYLRSTGVFFEPGIEFGFNYNAFTAGISCSYSFDLGNSKLYLYKKDDVILDEEKTKENSQWKGYRAGLFLRVSLFKNKGYKGSSKEKPMEE